MRYTFSDSEHVHSLDGRPLYGTSTVIKNVMPPFLAKWGAQCAVDHIKSQMGPEGLIGEVDKILADAVSAWSKVRQQAADKGTDMHAALEAYVNRCLENDGGVPQRFAENEGAVQLFQEWACTNVESFIASEVHTYSEKLWTGGIIDCIAKMKDGTLSIIDFKSSREAYFNQFVQAAGYALQVEEVGYGDAEGTNWQKLAGPIGKLVIVPFGAKKFKPEVIENVPGYKEVFESVVHVYEFMNSYNKK